MGVINEKMTALANAIRTLVGISDKIGLDAMAINVNNANNNINTEAELIAQIQESLQEENSNNLPSILQNNIVNLQNILEAVNNLPDSGGNNTPTTSVDQKDINFYDYDGTLLYSYNLNEIQNLNTMPPLPSHNGLICQGWNWSLADIKNRNNLVDVGAIYTTDDGTTRIHITLPEGRTSPMMGFCPNGTVTIDWGDGTNPSTLTGTSTSTLKWTSNHQYPSPGNYVIKLSVNGSMGFGGNDSNEYCYLVRHDSSNDSVNMAYQHAIKKIEIGNGITSFANNALHQCQGLKAVTIPNTITRVSFGAFNTCYSLPFVAIPNSVTKMEYYGLINCQSLKTISLPNSISSIDSGIYYGCQIMDYISIPNSVKYIYPYSFSYCTSLTKVIIPEGVTLIDSYSFNDCYSLTYINFPKSISSIGSEAFSNCRSIKYYDFSKHTSVPTLSAASAFNNMADDCEIRVPSSLLSQWKSATNWSTYANHIIGV